MERFARLMLCAALPVLAAVLWALWWAGQGAAVSFQALLIAVAARRVSWLAAGLAAAALVQAGAPPVGRLLLGGAAAVLLGWAALPEVAANGAWSAGGAGGAGRAGSEVLAAWRELWRWEAVFFAAVFLGTALGRTVRSGGGLVALLLCGAVGEAWLRVLRQAGPLSAAHPVRLLFFSRTAAGGSLSAADLLFAAAALEAARRLRFSRLGMVAGALLGGVAATFAAAAAGRAGAFFPMPSLWLIAAGIVTALWEELRCSGRELLKAAAAALVLSAAMSGLFYLSRTLNPPPPLQPQRTYRLARAARELPFPNTACRPFCGPSASSPAAEFPSPQL